MNDNIEYFEVIHRETATRSKQEGLTGRCKTGILRMVEGYFHFMQLCSSYLFQFKTVQCCCMCLLKGFSSAYISSFQRDYASAGREFRDMELTRIVRWPSREGMKTPASQFSLENPQNNWISLCITKIPGRTSHMECGQKRGDKRRLRWTKTCTRSEGDYNATAAVPTGRKSPTISFSAAAASVVE